MPGTSGRAPSVSKDVYTSSSALSWIGTLFLFRCGSGEVLLKPKQPDASPFAPDMQMLPGLADPRQRPLAGLLQRKVFDLQRKIGADLAGCLGL